MEGAGDGIMPRDAVFGVNCDIPSFRRRPEIHEHDSLEVCIRQCSWIPAFAQMTLGRLRAKATVLRPSTARA
jgi:hypothetical protein